MNYFWSWLFPMKILDEFYNFISSFWESLCINTRHALESVWDERLGPLNFVDLWLRVNRLLRRVVFKLLRTIIRKDTLAHNFTAGSSFTRETCLAPLFSLATLQCHRSSSLREGNNAGAETSRIIQNTGLWTSFQCFLALFTSLYVLCFFSRSFEAKLSCLTEEFNLNTGNLNKTT